MEARTALLFCLLLSVPLQAIASSSSGSGSGSGSGANNPPAIDNCPVSTLDVMVTPEFNVFTVNISILLAASDSDIDEINFFTNISAVTLIGASASSDNIITNASIEDDGSYLTLMIDGEVLNPVMMRFTELNISIFASDGIDYSCPCEVSVVIEYLQAAECQNGPVRSEIQQAASTITRTFFSASIPLRVPQFGAMEQATFVVAIASFVNQACSADCGTCSLTSNCAALLQQCAPFVSSDVNILDIIFLSGSRKRQSLQDIRVITAVGFPEELPTTGGTPFLPPPVLIQAITNNAEEFENVTGLLLNGSPTLFFVPPTDLFPFDFNEIAVIVLPIVVSVLVLALVIGIAIVLVVVFIMKNKKKSKVLPVNHDGDQSRQSSIGKGHMNVETV